MITFEPMLKRAVFLTISMIFMLGGFAQMQINGSSMASITGQWEGHPKDTISLLYNKVPFLNRPLEMIAITDENGKFQLRFPFENRWPLDLRHGENSITFIIAPKDSINIRIHADGPFYAYDFSGRGSEEAKLNYLNFRDFDRDRQEAFNQIVQHTTPEQYMNTMNSWKKEYQKVVDKNLRSIKPHELIKDRTWEMAKVKHATYLLVYIKYKRDSRDTSFSIPESWKTIIKNPKLRSLDYTTSPEYQNFIFLYLTQMGPTPTADACTNFKQYAAYSDSVFLSNSKVELMPRVILEATKNGCYKSVKPFYEAYKKYSTKPEYIQAMEQQIGQLVFLEPGEPAPDFTFMDKEGKSHSLAELRGKVIYLDFWATWCGPCIRAMKSSGPLKEHFKGNEYIAFVYISTDRDQNKWKGHYITNNGEPNQWHMGSSAMAASQAYRITSIPRYIIIDKEGNIVSGNAPRPYDPNLIPQLEELTKEEYKPKG